MKKTFGILVCLLLIAIMFSVSASIKIKNVNNNQQKISNYKNTDIVWDKTYGGRLFDEGDCAIQTIDGNYIFCGTTLSYAPSGTMDSAWLVKIDLYGNEIWSRTYGGEKRDGFNSVQLTSDGGYILTGYSSSFGSSNFTDLWLMKVDSYGNKQWDKTYGSSSWDYGAFAQQTSDGGYIVVGKTEKYSIFEDIWLIKTDAQGDLMWDKAFDTGTYEYGFCVQQTNDGGYILVGDIFTFDWPIATIAGWAIKTDSDGSRQWDKKFWYGTKDCETKYIYQTSDDGYIVAGSTACFGSTGLDSWLIKLDENGNEAWNRTYAEQNADTAYCVEQTSDGGFIFTGGAKGDVRLVKTDATGIMEWDRRFGGSNGEGATSVQQVNDGGYFIGGITRSYGAGYFDAWLIKTDENGKLDESNNRPNKPTTPSGPTDGRVGIKYTYTSNTIDSDGDMIYYWFDWDDGEASGWVGPFSSGETVKASHTWTIAEGYKIQVKAKDEYEREGEWSDTLFIKIEKKSRVNHNKLFFNLLERFPMLHRLLSLLRVGL